VDPRRQEGHGLELVLELGAVSRRSNLHFVLVVLTRETVCTLDKVARLVDANATCAARS
jgi:hypothetical protein